MPKVNVSQFLMRQEFPIRFHGYIVQWAVDGLYLVNWGMLSYLMNRMDCLIKQLVAHDKSYL